MKKRLILTILIALLFGACSNQNEASQKETEKQVGFVQKEEKAKKQENRKEDREGKKVNETIEWNDKEIIPDQTIYKSFYSFALSLYVSFTFYFLKA